jgi:cbb3-type cytochrome oxidase cytochrome c subunit
VTRLSFRRAGVFGEYSKSGDSADPVGGTSCHTAEGQGGTAGPMLDGINSRRSSQYVTEQIKNPRAHNPASIMPTVRTSDVQIGQIVVYLEKSAGANKRKRPQRFERSSAFGRAVQAESAAHVEYLRVRRLYEVLVLERRKAAGAA